jgi:hypothetical protein
MKSGKKETSQNIPIPLNQKGLLEQAIFIIKNV